VTVTSLANLVRVWRTRRLEVDGLEILNGRRGGLVDGEAKGLGAVHSHVIMYICCMVG
jgi:hypothetical protein